MKRAFPWFLFGIADAMQFCCGNAIPAKHKDVEDVIIYSAFAYFYKMEKGNRNNHDIKVDFRIVGENLDPNQVTRDLGIQPSEIWHMGDLVMPNSKSLIRYKVDGWSVHSGVESNTGIEPHFLALKEKLLPIAHLIKKYSNKFYSEFACTVYCYEEESIPVLHLSKEAVVFVAQLGAEIDYDLYRFPPREEE